MRTLYPTQHNFWQFYNVKTNDPEEMGIFPNFILNKRKYFKQEFLLEFNHKLSANIMIILRNYLMNELGLNYLQIEELMIDCKLVGNFLKEDLYVK